jgi:16S rRNA (guanine1207-N2)-methyltransferase
VLLAEHTDVHPGDVVVHLHCGNGLLGAVAAGKGAERVLLADRNVVAVDAARRTLGENGVANGEALLGQGMLALPAGVQADVVALRTPPERLALQQLLWDAFRLLKVGGRCYLAGATNEGVRTAERTMQRLFGGGRLLGQDSGHRVSAATKRAAEPASREDLDSPYLDGETFNQLPATMRGRSFILFTRPGVFSWDHLDEATGILADTVEVRVGERVLDLGCGAGALGTLAGTLSGAAVTMVDADVEAVRSATRTAAAAGLGDVRVATSDVAGAVLGEQFDVVVTNPPFHVGKLTDLDVPLQFIADAWTVLAPGGRLYLVANRTLPYERVVARRFGNIATVHDGARFKVLMAER